MLQNWKDSEFMKKPSQHISIFQKQVIHNMWTRNSILTVDRRNERDIVRIKKSEFNERFNGIAIPEEADFKPIIMKRNVPYYTALRHVATCSAQKIREKVCLVTYFILLPHLYTHTLSHTQRNAHTQTSTHSYTRKHPHPCVSPF